MATEKLTEYERKRLENIKRNDEMVAALKVHAKASLLSAATKRQRVESKSCKTNPDKKKNKSETPVVIRRSLRTRGMPPDSSGLADDFSETPNSVNLSKSAPREIGPLAMKDAYSGAGSDRNFIDTIVGIAKKTSSGASLKEEIGYLKSCKKEEPIDSPVKSELRRCTRASRRLTNVVKTETSDFPVKVEKNEFEDSHGVRLSNVAVKTETSDFPVKVEKSEFVESLDLGLSNVVIKRESSDFRVKDEKSEFGGVLDVGTLCLEPDNIARVVPGRILVVKFLPSLDVRMVAAGDKFGNVGFWHMDCEDEDDGIYLYHPHPGPVSSISFQPNSLPKIITSCYDGYIRLMDAEKEVFALIHSSENAIYSLKQHPNDVNNLYFGEGYGGFNVWDLRAGKSSFQWSLHERRINTIDFNIQCPYIMATSSTDGTACLWDLRSVGAQKKPKTLHTVNHERAVHSAYFSPSGCSLATTSTDNNVGLSSCIRCEDTSLSMIYHYNQTGRWISNFRGVWGWDDSYVFIGNMSRGVDVISTVQRKTVMTLQSPHMTAIQCRFDAHPLNVGMLAGATAGGQVYVWTPKSKF